MADTMEVCKKTKAEQTSEVCKKNINTKNETVDHFWSRLNEGFGVPDKVSNCKWSVNSEIPSPHRTVDWRRTEKILPNILHAIGNTPLVRLNSIPKTANIQCEVLVKCEYFNPGGSIKDRIAYRMVEDAEKAGILKSGSTIIEPTSGNTGIGLALAAAVKGYRCIIVMSEKMSSEKVNVLKSLGAEVVRTPVSAASDSAEGLFGVSNRLKKEIPNSVILDQYSNPGNPLAHYDTTAEEILDQCNGKLDMVVIGTGTGGSATGIGRKIKEKSPSTVVVGVDPEGSILALPDSLNKTDVDFYEVEGIGYDFIPTVLDRSVMDKWVKVTDKEALPMAKRLIKEEGFLSGGSSGANVAGGLKACADLKKGQRVVIILPDSIRNYLTKFVSDHWMEERHLQEPVNNLHHWWWDIKLEKISMRSFKPVKADMSCQDVISLLKAGSFEVAPVLTDKGELDGVVTLKNILLGVTSGKIKTSGKIVDVIERIFPKATNSTCLGVVSRILEKQSYLVIVDESKNKATGIVNATDFLDFISKQTS